MFHRWYRSQFRISESPNTQIPGWGMALSPKFRTTCMLHTTWNSVALAGIPAALIRILEAARLCTAPLESSGFETSPSCFGGDRSIEGARYVAWQTSRGLFFRGKLVWSFFGEGLFRKKKFIWMVVKAKSFGWRRDCWSFGDDAFREWLPFQGWPFVQRRFHFKGKVKIWRCGFRLNDSKVLSIIVIYRSRPNRSCLSLTFYHKCSIPLYCAEKKGFTILISSRHEEFRRGWNYLLKFEEIT